MRVRLGAYNGTTLSPEAVAAYNDVMNRVANPVMDAIGDLRDQVSGYSWAKLITLGPIAGSLAQAPEETRRAIHSALNSSDAQMRLRDSSRADVLAGTLPLNKWIASVNTVFDGVKDIAKDLSEGTLLSQYATAFADAKRDANAVIDRVSRIVGGIADQAGTFGLPVLGLLAVLAVVFVVPRLLSGTTFVVRERYKGFRGQMLGPLGRKDRLQKRRIY